MKLKGRNQMNERMKEREKKKKKKKKKTQVKNHDEKLASFDGRKQANNKGVRLERLAVACHGPCQANTVTENLNVTGVYHTVCSKLGPGAIFFLMFGG